MAAKKSAPSPKPLTLEEQIAAAIARDSKLDSYAVKHLPIPQTVPEVGEEVYLGNLHDVVVVAVIEEGRRVVVQHTEVSRRDSVKLSEKIVRVVPTFEVQKKTRASQESFGTPNYYPLNYSQRDIAGLVTMLSSFGVDMNPEYQRELAWEESDKVRLIDSIFNQVDIGKFVFRKLPFKSDGPGYEVVDGKQRLNALLEFMADRFAYRGKKWSELSRFDRGYFESYSISYAELHESYTRAQVLELFVRLNTGGKPMDPHHLQRVALMAKEASPSTPSPRSPGPKP